MVHTFDQQLHQQSTGTYQLPSALTELIVQTLQHKPRQQATTIVDSIDYTSYLPLDPYYHDHICDSAHTQ